MKYLIILTNLIFLGCVNSFAQTKIAAKNAADYIGKTVTVLDRVDSLSHDNNFTFIYLGTVPSHLLILKIKNNSLKEQNTNPTLSFNKGSEVAVTGKITAYKGKPEIVLQESSQIKLNLLDNMAKTGAFN